ncbi:MAG: serine esterase, putative, partial [uncultured Rubrobacteraceae bacterium]
GEYEPHGDRRRIREGTTAGPPVGDGRGGAGRPAAAGARRRQRRLPLRARGLRGPAACAASVAAARGGRGRARRPRPATPAGGRGRPDLAGAQLARADLGPDPGPRALRPGRRRHRRGSRSGVLPLRRGPRPRGGGGLLRRRLLRALAGYFQRRPLRPRPRVLARVHGAGRTGGLPALLCLPRHPGPMAPHRQDEPQARARARGGRLRGSLPGIRRPARGIARDRAGGRGLACRPV